MPDTLARHIFAVNQAHETPLCVLVLPERVWCIATPEGEPLSGTHATPREAWEDAAKRLTQVPRSAANIGPEPDAFVSASQPFGRTLLSNTFAPTSLRRMAPEVSIGDTTYRLREPLTLTFYPFVHKGMGELIAESSRPEIDQIDVTGTGVSIEDAFTDWASKLHVHVQSLLAKRPWEMSQDEVKEMAAIERLIDIPAYHSETPIRVREIGTVARCRPIPDRIRWEDGHVETVVLDQMPPDFAAFKNGQRFESITLRDSVTGRLLRVVHVARLSRLPATIREGKA